MDKEDYQIDDSGFVELTGDQKHFMAADVGGWTRFIAAIPALGLFIAALALSVGTFAQTVITTLDWYFGDGDIHQVTVKYVEYADLFLLAIALFVLSLGIIRLFITDKVVLPRWLTFEDFDDLKERLASVISIMLAVYFLGNVLNGAEGANVLFLGAGCALVIVALAVFVRPARALPANAA